MIVPEIIQYSIVWPFSKASQVLNKWKKESQIRPNNFNEDLLLYYNPLTRNLGIELSGIYVINYDYNYNYTVDNVIKEIKGQLSNIVKDYGGKITIQPKVPYSTLYKNLVKTRQYNNFSIIQTFFSNKIHGEQVMKMMELAKTENLMGSISISFTLLGGRIKNVSPRETAFYPRNKNFFIDVATRWSSIENSQPIENWTNQFVDNLLKVEDTYAYVGFPITFSNIKYTNHVYYGRNYPRLQKVKAQYDPLNILTHCGTIIGI